MPTQQRIILRLNGVHVFGDDMNNPYINPSRIVPTAFIALWTMQCLSSAIAEPPSLHSQQAAQNSEIIDIISNASDHDLNLLVKLKHQPHIAATQITDNGFTLSISGLLLHQASIDPPTNTYITSVEVRSETNLQSSKLEFSTPRLTQIRTEIFKNAILVSAKLANPAPLNSHTAAQRQQLSITAPQNTRITPPQSINQEKHFRDVFQLSASYCMQAEKLLSEDAWNLEAVADHALCMTADGKLDEAQISVDQIQSFSPNNWKAALTAGEILRLKGDVSQSKIQFSYAMQYVENPEIKKTIADWAARN